MTIQDRKLTNNSKIFNKLKNKVIMDISNSLIEYKIKLWNNFDISGDKAKEISQELDKYFAEKLKEINKLLPKDIKKLFFHEIAFKNMLKKIKR